MSQIDFQNGLIVGLTSGGIQDVSSVQSDYLQNDETAEDYIKNRPFYKEELEVDYTTLYYDEESNPMVYNKKLGLVLGEEYTIDLYAPTGEMVSFTETAIDFSDLTGIADSVGLYNENELFMIADEVAYDADGNIVVGNGAIYNMTEGCEKMAIRGIPSVDTIIHPISVDYIATNSITANKIADESITSNKIKDKSITAEKIASNSITIDKIANNSIDAYRIVDNSITGDKIMADTIDTIRIKDKAVTGEKIADQTIPITALKKPVKFSSMSIEPANGKISTYSNTGVFYNCDKMFITGKIVSSDTTNTQQIFVVKALYGMGSRNILEIPADFSNSKVWDMTCVVEKPIDDYFRCELTLMSEDSKCEQIHIVTPCQYTTLSNTTAKLSGVSLCFGDVDSQKFAAGTSLTTYAFE